MCGSESRTCHVGNQRKSANTHVCVSDDWICNPCFEYLPGRYNPDEVRTLKGMREIPEAFRVVETMGGDGFGSEDEGDDIGFNSDSDKEAIDIENI